MRFPRPIRRPADHYTNPDLRFHVTIHAHPEIARWPRGLGDDIWRRVMEQRTANRVELYAACLMPDHLHLLIRPDATDVIRFLNVWKSWTTRTAWQYGIRGGLWQPGMWDRTIRNQDDFDRTVEYIVRNPATAGLVDPPESWPWVWAWHWE